MLRVGFVRGLCAASTRLGLVTVEPNDLTELRRLIGVMDAETTWSERYHDATVRLLHALPSLLDEVEQLRAKLAAVLNYCNDADKAASRNMIGGVVLPWAGAIRFLLSEGGAACSICGVPDHSAEWKHAESELLTASIVPGLVERIQHAARQVDSALEDTRVGEGAAAWLRTIKATLIDGDGEMARAALVSSVESSTRPTDPENDEASKERAKNAAHRLRLLADRTADYTPEGLAIRLRHEAARLDPAAAVQPDEAPTPGEQQ